MIEKVDHLDLEIGSSVWYADMESGKVIQMSIVDINITLSSKNPEKIKYTSMNEDLKITIDFYQGEDYKKYKIFLSPQLAQDYLDGKDDDPGKLFMLYETDGYRDRDIKPVIIPYRFIRGSNILNSPGLEWFRKNVHGGFDNGGYYRLREVKLDEINKIIDKIEKYTEIVDMWNSTTGKS